MGKTEQQSEVNKKINKGGQTRTNLFLNASWGTLSYTLCVTPFPYSPLSLPSLPLSLSPWLLNSNATH